MPFIDEPGLPSENRSGVLFFGGCSAPELAERFGTPLYVYDENRIKSNFLRVRDAFRKHCPHFDLYYAVKANNNLAILKILEKEGAGVDVSSPSEIYLAQKAGFSAERMLYSGNFHTDEELQGASKKNIRMNLDDTSQMERLKKMDIVPDFISFRINPGMGSAGHEKLITAGPNVKFGIREGRILEAYALAKESGVREFGVHMMTGSNILDPEYFESVTGRLMDIVGKLVSELSITIKFIDLGGGLGVPYLPSDRPLDIDKTAKKVSERFLAKADEFGLGKVTLMMEPGRYIVADAGILLARVHSIKRSDSIFIGTDAGMNTLLRPALYGAYHEVALANRMNDRPEEKVTVVGQICEDTDRLADNRLLPVVEEGDLLGLMDAGAYGFSMSSQYNTRPKAAEVLVHDGDAELIRKRESDEDISRNMIVPRRLL